MKAAFLILILAATAAPVLAQNSQKALSRRTENIVFKDGKRIVKAYRYESVVYDDQGKEFAILHAKKGKLRGPKDVRPGELWIQHDGNEVHNVTVEVKDVDDDLSTMPLVAPSRWALNSTVCVTIHAGFTDEQEEAIYLAGEAWNAAGVAKFVRVGPCDATVTVERYPVIAERKGTAAATIQETLDGVLISARILIDPKTQKVDALRSLVAHELGHSLGLPDCNGCKGVMRSTTPGVNKSNGYSGPSDVDLAAFK